MWLTKFAIALATAYVVIVVFAYAMQSRLLFPAGLASAGHVRLPANAVPLEVTTPDNENLKGVHIAPVNANAPGSPWILGFGGNAWNATAAANFLHKLFPDHDIVVFHYRGYGPSTGRPDAETLLSDAVLVFDHLRKQLGARKVVGVGFSIGSGVAAHLAAHRQLAGLILVSPFDSLKRLASDHYPWLPVSWLLRHKMETATAVSSVTTPTAVITGERDEIIPSRRTAAVRNAISNLILDRTIKGAGHNDLYDRPEFHSTIAEALKRIEIGMVDG